ncbi:MAG: hypothetical protein JWM82_877, partial [Myxococcales bacterium]|nr:hypothetical protein [Myxococcales bacterium]
RERGGTCQRHGAREPAGQWRGGAVGPAAVDDATGRFAAAVAPGRDPVRSDSWRPDD